MKWSIETIFVTLLFFVAVISARAQSLQVKIHNKTGYDIDSLTVGKQFVGRIHKDSSTVFLNFRGFKFDGNDPIEPLRGIVENSVLEDLRFFECGTMHNTKTAGKYVFDLELRNGDPTKTYLILMARQ